jgi:purine-binding chemotaxis protein CheW
MASNAVAKPYEAHTQRKSEMQPATDRRAGKYLIFELGNEEFGVSVLQVKEIMKMQQVTMVPQTPAFVQGVINLRGRIVPVLSLRSKFSMSEAEYTDRTCIIVVRVETQGGEQAIGIIVDSVVEVLFVSADDIEDTPDFGGEVKTTYLRGIAKSKGKVKILVDIDRVLSSQELGGLATLGTF